MRKILHYTRVFGRKQPFLNATCGRLEWHLLNLMGPSITSFRRLMPGKVGEDKESDPSYHNGAEETNSSYQIQFRDIDKERFQRL